MMSRHHPQYEHSPLRLDRCGDLASLRHVLEDARYDEASVAATVLADDCKPLDLVTALRRTDEPTPHNTLVRLFVLAFAVSQQAAEAALGETQLEQLGELGLLKQTADGFRSEASLMASEGLWLVRDFWPDFVGSTRTDFVLGVGPASRALAGVTVRIRVESVLDLGTGCGYQALLAARHAGRVVATDTNPRALNFTAFNAKLNELPNVELRQGSLYEPVDRQQFDLLVCNPPFVISPRSDYEYCDSGMPADSISEQVIRGAPGQLCEGAYASVLFDWHHGDDDDWARRPTEWLAENGCDCWLLCFKTTDPISYAATWLHHERSGDPQAYQRLLDNWLSYYEQTGIGRISSGTLVMRRRPGGANWLRAEKCPPGQAAGSCGDQIQRVFAAADLLAGLADQRELLDMSFLLTADHRLEQVLHAEDGNWMVQEVLLKQVEGFPFVGKLDRLMTTVLAGCDGRHTLGQLAAEIADGLHVDREQVAAACTAVTRKLLETGFLVVS